MVVEEVTEMEEEIGLETQPWFQILQEELQKLVMIMEKRSGKEICIHSILPTEIKLLQKEQIQNLLEKEPGIIVTKLEKHSVQKTQSALKGIHPTQEIRIPNLQEQEEPTQKSLQLKQTRILGQKILTSIGITKTKRL